MRVYEAIAKGLEGAGVRVVFGGAGENSPGLMAELEHSPRITPVITRHEQAASFMACGYAMYTDQLGVCCATAGPGAFNLFSGLAVALSDSYPVLAVSGYARRKWRGWGALNETSGLNRTPDSQAMFKATTKESFVLEDAADTCEVLEAAVNLAFSGRPGPVHIHVPDDLTEQSVQVENFRPLRLHTAPVLPDPAQVEEIASVLAEAIARGRRIVALVGFGAVRSGAGPEIRRMIERFQIPLLTTLDGKGTVSEGHPLAVGVFADSGHASAWKAFREAEVVLCVGNSLNQRATFDFRENLFEDKLLIHVNISETEFRKAYTPDYALLSDARRAVAALVDALENKVGEVAPAEVDGRDYEARRIVHVQGKIHPGELALAMGRLLPPKGVLLADAGAQPAWLGYYVELEEGQNFRKAGSFGPVAGHANGAIGVKLAHPERTVVVGCGCHSLSGFELLTAVENDIPVIWVVFNDRNPDFAAYARACGVDGHRVDTLDEFGTAFHAALASGRPTVIDARITVEPHPPDL